MKLADIFLLLFIETTDREFGVWLNCVMLNLITSLVPAGLCDFIGVGTLSE